MSQSQRDTILNLVKTNNIKNILDIGANLGEFSLMCKSIIPDSTIYMIEGNPNCEEFLKNTSIEYFIALLSDKEQEVSFYINSSNPVCTGSSYYKEITGAYSNPIERKIKTKLLDDLFLDIDIKFDLIKIDVQGAELDVIRGGNKTISNASFILCECPYIEDSSIPRYNQNSCILGEIVEELGKMGFNNHEILEDLCIYTDQDIWKSGTIVAKEVLFYK